MSNENNYGILHPSNPPRPSGRIYHNSPQEPPSGVRLSVEDMISAECDSLKELLLEKNKKYGNSALEPLRIFSQANPVEQLLVRVDDKLSRLKTMGVASQPDEDTVQDLMGYLVLLRVALRSGVDEG